MMSIRKLRSAADIPSGIPPAQERCLRAYWQMKPTIDKTYPPGHFVALYDGELAGDAATSAELMAALRAAGKDLRNALIVQSGADELTYAILRFMRRIE
jgi:hypothetical protein